MGDLLDTWRERAKRLRRETYALYLAYRDPRVSWYARVFAGAVVAYAFSPLDLIPDFVPVLGYVDDLVLVPLGIMLAIKLIPACVMEDSRARADAVLDEGLSRSWVAAAAIVVVWLILAALALILLRRIFFK
jgi:uncharacterized membrane protein YkvA (DUF1232 family)